MVNVPLQWREAWSAAVVEGDPPEAIESLAEEEPEEEEEEAPTWWFEDEHAVSSSGSSEVVKLTPSEWTEFAITVPVEGVPTPFSFAERDYLRTVYDVHVPRLLLCFGRQSEKSTTLGNSILARMATMPYFRALYVSPTQEQTKVFRRDRIGDPIAYSDVLRAYLSDEHANNVGLVKFFNYAQLTLRYCFLSADRVRGVSVDATYIDEIQDILTHNIPVIEECASHGSPSRRMYAYAGTPKTFDNTMEYMWSKRSTQNEWAVPCDCKGIFLPGQVGRMRFWNVPLQEEHIGPRSLICSNCQRPISSIHPEARWVTMNPAIRTHGFIQPIESFRVPHIMVPWLSWPDLLNKRATYPRARFVNEVLAQPYDSGVRPLRMQDLMGHSHPDLVNAIDDQVHAKVPTGTHLFMGIDWGTGERAFTVVTIGAYLHGVSDHARFSFLYMHRFTGADIEPRAQLDEIHRLVALYKPSLIGVDYGGGFDRNKELINHYGAHRVARYQYTGGIGSAGAKKKVRYDAQKGRYMIDRTEVMSDMFNAIREGKFYFPRWETWAEPYANDFLAIFAEYNDRTHSIQYNISPNATDDTYHAALYCFFASMLVHPRRDVLRPVQEHR